ncbi:metal-dependent transcriptional regulator [Salinibacterium sp. SWN167]|uniref:metal-dependent transcriptional regulator n=1 Tax=Salinibacterium sp. SWN167 TaxID=2792054 RepID=UPI0018CE3F10|nr:metal-dependent transcriptional regulator [Salinibacterium sp. SWN167]MBH0083588.1 metal-dependent transcriptional regulator [Salinibacterium sp. SWN167]
MSGAIPNEQPTDVDAISFVAQDYLKAIWSATEWGDPPITTKALAARFGTSPANVTDTLHRLAAQQLVDYRPYKPVQLTKTGARLAIAMVRRHRIIETFLVTTLDYGWDEVHDEAERLEHAATNTLIDRMDALLGFPTSDPHGDPIPTAEGHTNTARGAIRLASAAPGRYRVQRISDAEAANLEIAVTLQVAPGRVVDTHSADGECYLTTADGSQAVPATFAGAVWVTRIDPSAP